MNKEELLQAHRSRHACKEFDNTRKISEEDFAFILETGRLSPSSFGFEPWQFVVLQNKQIREKLLPVTWGGQRQIPTASHFVLLLTRTNEDMMPNSEHILHMLRDVRKVPQDIVDGMMDRYLKFLESDFKLIANERAMFEWLCRQTYLALSNMMTAAAQIGIDSCPIEGFDKDKVEAILQEEGILDREHFGLACMAAFGYRLHEPRPKTRRPIEEVVNWVR